MTELRFSGQAPSQAARQFLSLLDDVYRIQGLFLDEIAALRARIAELEAGGFPGEVPGCAVYRVSPEGGIASWSSGARELYGYDPEEVLGRSPVILQPEATRSRDARVNAGAAFPRRNRDGSTFLVHVQQSVLRDEAGGECGRLFVELPLGAKPNAAGAGV